MWMTSRCSINPESVRQYLRTQTGLVLGCIDFLKTRLLQNMVLERPATPSSGAVAEKELDDSDTNSPEVSVKQQEGGAAGWLTVFGSCLVYFSAFGIINSFGFFQDLYQDDYLKSVPSSTISFIGTIQITLMNVLAAPAGTLFDCYGLKVRSIQSCLCENLCMRDHC